MSDQDGAEDYYRVLGVPKDASVNDIKKAFRSLARELHPDVNGEDPAKVERFKKVRDAYEVLSDPVQRARYDRRGERFVSGHSGFGGGGFGPNGRFRSGPSPQASRQSPQRSDLDLEDIFNDFAPTDFGFGGKRTPSGGVSGNVKVKAAAPEPGKDITVSVDVSREVAARGGTVTLRYQRLRRGDDGRTLFRFDEIHDLKVPPGATHGSTLRVPLQGDAGANGGPYGDLVCDLKIPAPPPHSDRMKMPKKDPEPEGVPGDRVLVNVGIAEAILGGRVLVDTPGGVVKVTIPPGTSSGVRLRLRGKGHLEASGQRGDIYAEVRIVVPREIDAESRALIERFAALNPSLDE